MTIDDEFYEKYQLDKKGTFFIDLKKRFSTSFDRQ